MGSTVPWWGTSIFALGGTVFGAFVTGMTGWLAQRSQRRRLSRDEKVAAYLDLINAARKLARTPVWPVEAGDAEDQLQNLLELAERVMFFGPAQVNGAIQVLLTAAREHRKTVAAIREDSKPGYRGGLDRSFQEKYRASVTDMHSAVDNFARAARKDLEIKGPYHPPGNDESSSGELE